MSNIFGQTKKMVVVNETAKSVYTMENLYFMSDNGMYRHCNTTNLVMTLFFNSDLVFYFYPSKSSPISWASSREACTQ